MKTYTLEVVIRPGSDEFWEDLWEEAMEGGGTGCDLVLRTVRDILFDAGFQPPNCTVMLHKFEETFDERLS